MAAFIVQVISISKKISTIHTITHATKHITKTFEIFNNRLKNASIKYILVCSCIEVIMSKLVEWFVTRQTSTEVKTRSTHMYIGWPKTTLGLHNLFVFVLHYAHTVSW